MGEIESTGVRAVYTTRERVREDVRRRVRKEGLTLTEFVKRGRAGELNNDRLESIWMLTRRALV